MPNSATLPTTTIATATLNAISIFTFFNRNSYFCSPCDISGYTDNPQIKQVNIQTFAGYENGSYFEEGYLVIAAENVPSEVDFWIDNMGNFIVKGNDAASYSVDDNGDLVYDLCNGIC